MSRARAEAPVITGVGVVTALGYGVATNEAALFDGASAVSPAGDVPAAIAASPYLRSPVPEALEPQLKFLNGAGELAVEAALEATEQAGVASLPTDSSRRGLFLAQRESHGWTCTDYRAAFVAATREFREPLEPTALNRASVRRIKPYFLLENLHNNAFSFLASCFGLRGTNASCAGFGAASAPVLDLAVEAVRRGDLDAALVVGAARMAGPVVRHEARLLPEPARESLGAPGDGAGALLIESADAARSRGVGELASVLGVGLTTGRPAGPWHLPAAETVAAAVRQAISAASIDARQIRAVVAPFPGGSHAGDLLAGAVRQAAVGYDGPWLSWRGATGNMGTASLVAEVGLAAAGLTERRLPGTVPADEQAPAVALEDGALIVLHVGRFGEVGAVLLRTV